MPTPRQAVMIVTSIMVVAGLSEPTNAVGPIFDETDPRPLTARCFCYAVAVADLDADGHNDVVAIHNQLGDYACFNDGQGNFTRQYLGDFGGRSWGLTIADFDHDGDLDILPDVGTSNGVWYRNDGARVFAMVAPVVEHVVGAGDLNHDGFVDLIARQSGLDAFVYLNNGDGSFQLSQSLPGSGGPGLGDVDGDDDLDLATGGKLWLNDGSGIFFDSEQDLSIPGVGTIFDGTRLFADINNDNHLDLVVANYLGGCYAFLNDGSGSLIWTGETLLPTQVVALGDVDLDGNLDLVMADGPGHVYLGDGQGGFDGPVQTFPPGDTSSQRAVALGYLNGDLAIDVVVGAAGPDTCGAPLAYINAISKPEVFCLVEEDLLSPPNHNLIDVGFDFIAIDDTDPDPVIEVMVFADEDDEEPTDSGNHSPDAKDDGETLRLRAERRGNGDGRVYLIVVIATNAAGNEGFDCCTVVVPKSQSKKHIADVAEHATIAKAFCLEFSEEPPGFVEVGDGPIIGPKQ